MMLGLVEGSASVGDLDFVAALCETAAKAEIGDEMMWALSNAMEEMQVRD